MLKQGFLDKLSIAMILASDLKYVSDEDRLQNLMKDVGSIMYEYPVTSIIFGYIERSVDIELATLFAPHGD